ncbi:MAG: hypothetical protein HDS70_08680 [Bacteroidales bacterium]|nr:hypothetical protein [Bacteroidales bacterium]
MGVTALGLSALSGGFSLLGNMLGFASNQATNAANKKLMSYQHDLNLDLWNKNNEYNSPQAQMQRLKAAGLNPNLVYGSGAVGNASSMPNSPTAIPQQSYQNFGTLGIGDAVNTFMASEQLKIQQDMADADFRLKDQQWNMNEVTNTLNEITLLKEKILTAETEVEKSIYEQQLRQNLYSLELDNYGKNLDNEYKANEINMQAVKMREAEANIELILAKTNLTNEQAKEVSHQIALMASQIRLNNANASLAEFEYSMQVQMKPLLLQYGISPTGNDWQRLGYTLFQLFTTDNPIKNGVVDIFNEIRGKKGSIGYPGGSKGLRKNTSQTYKYHGTKR